MGMANAKQKGEGIHFRLRSRAFVVKDGSKQFAFVSLDSGMGGIVLKNRVIANLATRLPGQFSIENVCISGTHTHSGPSGFLQHTIFQFAGSGWVPQTLDAFANGVTESIVLAYKNLQSATGSVAVSELTNASVNRSPTAYLLNPEAERARYKYDTDKNMTLLRIDAEDGTPLASFNWFAVHGTSMNNTNKLISGDNKGYASYLFEKEINGDTSVVRPGHGAFVAGFAQTNLGDVSPNTRGAHCQDTGLPCDAIHSTCNGKTQLCVASGPGNDMFESTEIIGRMQFDHAKDLWEAAKSGGMALEAEVDYVHAWMPMAGSPVTDPVTGEAVGELCSAAMGDSFAGGTTDGPGMFDFTQGSNSTSLFWNLVVGLLHPSKEEKACHHPKGILLPTGDISIPYPWDPEHLPVQMLRIGQLVILAVPTEFTTMSGRRLREIVRQRLVAGGVLRDADGTVVIAGLSNGYADYTTTFEEYQQQRYEGGSTAWGPHELNGFINAFVRLADSMVSGNATDPGTPAKDFSSKCLNTGPKLGTDHYPSGAKAFGDVLKEDPTRRYEAGKDVVEVAFASTDPLNNLRPQGTFLEVQRCVGVGADPAAAPRISAAASCAEWGVVAEDGDWETRVRWVEQTVDVILKARTFVASWHVPAMAPPGTYRMVHYGTARDDPLIGSTKLTEYTGTSTPFAIAASA